MLHLDMVIIRLYFPQFDSPPVSRFEPLFKIFVSESNLHNDNIKSRLIIPERVIKGIDKRTSLVIKYIPKDVSKRKIIKLLEKYGNINFILISRDLYNPNLKIAYINVINYKSVLSIYKGLKRNSILYSDKIYHNNIIYSKIQGKENLMKKFRA